MQPIIDMSCVVANEVSHCMLLRIGVATCLNDSLIHLTGSVVVQSAGQADRWDKGRWGAGAGGGDAHTAVNGFSC